MIAPKPRDQGNVRHSLAPLFAPVDIGSLAFFRIYFGAMMLWELWDLYYKQRIAACYIDPAFHFTYHGFSWVQPWPGDGMYLHFAALALCALCVMTGFLYRWSALLLWLCFTYVFLLEKAIYLNHYYLMCLLCFLLVFLPAHRAWSIDALLRPSLESRIAPAWALWLLRFQIAMPYVLGGIAKLQGDWLRGQPMQMWLSFSAWRVVLGPMAEEHWFALLFSWGGLIFDLAIVPLLLWPRTRGAAFVVAVLFHLMNAFMLDIGIFPWLMIGATTVFLAPDWPRRLLSDQPSTPKSTPIQAPPAPVEMPQPRRQRIIASLLLVYVVLQLAIPFRQWLYPGNVLWTEQASMFAWNMMLRAKVTAMRFLVTDRATGWPERVDITRWLTDQQVESMGQDPEMMREFAVFLRRQYQDEGRDMEVRVLALCSLNGRKPQPIIDPAVDLSRQPRTLLSQGFIVPLREPLRWPAWDVPIPEWESHLMNPVRK